MKTLLIATSLLLASQAQANTSCNFTLEHDLLINNQVVALQTNQQDLWRIDNNGQLWLAGQKHTTDADTRQLLRQYQTGVRQQATMTVEIVSQAMLLATDALSQVVSELTGKPVTASPAIQQAFVNIQHTTDAIIVKNDDTLELKGSQLSKLDHAFGDEFSRAIEDLVQDSIGNIMLQIGKAMMSGQGSFEQRMEAFGQRMEHFGNQLEQRLQAKADLIEQDSEALCAQMQELNTLESRIQQRIPAMAQFDLFADSTLVNN
ncbi:DUF2884 family protein [Alishewanella longhuensis]